jgi:hypothetical protein
MLTDRSGNRRWFKYDRNYLCVNKSQFVPVIFEPTCTSREKCHAKESRKEVKYKNLCAEISECATQNICLHW